MASRKSGPLPDSRSVSHSCRGEDQDISFHGCLGCEASEAAPSVERHFLASSEALRKPLKAPSKLQHCSNRPRAV
eukprot:878729-Alexandrium_andersonii.AAC.1